MSPNSNRTNTVSVFGDFCPKIIFHSNIKNHDPYMLKFVMRIQGRKWLPKSVGQVVIQAVMRRLLF